MCSTTHKSTLPSSASLNENVRNVEVVVLDDNGKVAGVEKGTTTIPPQEEEKGQSGRCKEEEEEQMLSLWKVAM